MTFDDYEKIARSTDSTQGHPFISAKFMSIALGLAGETGEIMEKLKKICWHKDGIWTEEDKKELAKELGDVLWYLNLACFVVGTDLEEIATLNIEKLRKRYPDKFSSEASINRVD